MTKKKYAISFILALCLMVSMAFVLVACGSPTHNAAEEWTSDETGHWHACLDEGCQEKLDFEAHTYVEHICETCGAVDSEVVATLTIDNDVVAYLDFASAIDAIEDKASMKVYKDVTTDEKVNLSSNLTIDLGGNTWTSNSENGVNDVDGSVLTLKNGTLNQQKVTEFM